MSSGRTSWKDGLKRLLVERAPSLIAALPSVMRSGIRVNVTKDRLRLDDRHGRQIWLSRANAVYLSDVAQSFEYYFSAVEPFVLPGSLGGGHVVDYSTPRHHRVVGFNDFPVLFPTLAEPYQTCQQYLEFAQLREGQTAFDLGCYSGLTTIAFSKVVLAAGRVVGVEPDPGNMVASRINVTLHRRINSLDNVTLLQAAVCSKAGPVTFSAEGSMGSAIADIVGQYRGSVIQVPGLTLEEILAQSGSNRVDFIKMDIEGAELGVLQGAGTFLRKHRPRLIIEPHRVDGKMTTRDIQEILRSYGYHVRTIEQLGVPLPLVTAVYSET